MNAMMILCNVNSG
jgi:hypothetical protein